MLRLRTKKVNNRKGLSSGKPPLASLLTFFSKERDDTTVINKLDDSGDSDGSIVGKNIVSLNNGLVRNNDVSFGDIYPPSEYGTEMGDFTVCLNIDKLTYFSGTIHYFLGKYISTGDNRCFSITEWNGGQIRFLYTVNGGSSYNSVIIKGDIDCKQIILRYTNSTDTLTYIIDGVFNSKTLSTKIYNGDTSFTLNSAGGAVPDRGNVDLVDLYFWDRALSDTEITGLCSGGKPTNGLILACPCGESDGNILFDISGNDNHGTINGTLDSIWEKDLTKAPYSLVNGYSVIDGYDEEVPSLLLNPTIDALNGNPLTNPAISKISNLGDGYYKLPSGIKVNGLNLFNRDDTTIYKDACRTAEEYVSEDPYLWHVDELNTERILSYLNDAYKFTWFVKNTFTEGTYEPLTIKEIFAYSQKIADSDDLNKIKAYIGYNWS